MPAARRSSTGMALSRISRGEVGNIEPINTKKNDLMRKLN
jgi:hypothetical protein